MDLLHALFQTLRPDEQIYVWRKSPHERRLFDSPQEVEEYVEGLDDKADVYFGVAPRIRGAYDTVSRVTAVWADLDFSAFGDSQEKAKDALMFYPVEPSFVVASGHGLHAYWLLEEGIPGDVAQRIMRDLTAVVGADPTHDPPHVLRVPGTVNAKRPEAPCAVKELLSQKNFVYNPEDLERLGRLSSRALHIIATGSTKDFASRSERDWFVVRELIALGIGQKTIEASIQQKKWGNRYREDPRLLRVDLEKAKSPFASAELRFIEAQDCLFFITQNGKHQVSTFTFEPERLLTDPTGGAEDALLGTVRAAGQVWKERIFPRSAFSSQAKLHGYLPMMWWQWTGNDYETRQYLIYLMARLQQSGGGRTFVTSTMGRHEDMWVYREGAITTEGIVPAAQAPYIFMAPSKGRGSKKDTWPELSYELLAEDDYRALCIELGEHIPNTNTIGAVLPILGWFCANPLKPLFGAAGIRFPHLNVFGTMGAGKTSSLLKLYMPLLGMTDPKTWTTQTTTFVMRCLLAGTNALPVIFGEFRASTSEAARNDFAHIIRQAYDTGLDARGRADQSTNVYALDAPIIIDGEDAVNDGALRERCIIVNLQPADIAVGSAAYTSFEHLAALPLHHFAGHYIQRTLHETAESVYERWERYVEETSRVFDEGLPDRVRKNISVVCVGLELFCEHMEAWSAPAPEWKLADLGKQLRNASVRLATGVSRTMFDDFIEDLVGVAANQGVTSTPFISYYQERDKVLWVHLATAIAWWDKSMRARGRSGLEVMALRAQLQERCENGGYALPEQTLNTGTNQRLSCFGVSLPKCQEVGLDVPDGLAKHITLARRNEL